MTPIEAKLKAVRDWATPKDVKDVRSFFGVRKLLTDGSYKTLHQLRIP